MRILYPGTPTAFVGIAQGGSPAKASEMNQPVVHSRRTTAPRRSCGSPMIEGLESRCLLSASPLAHFAATKAASVVQLKPAAPAKITAGSTGTESVTIRNLGTESETEDVTITLAPSLNGTTPAGAYTSPPVTQSVTLKPHGSATIKVPFVPPDTLVGGKYHTLATVVVGGTTYNATAPGTYTLVVPPGPTTTPSLIGHYSGLITATSSSGGGIFGGGSHTVKQATFIWFTTAQDLNGLTGQFNVGSGQTTGTMTGSETTTGTFTYTLASDNINYVIAGKVTPDGKTLKGTFKGTLVNNIFAKLNGNFKITLQTS